MEQRTITPTVKQTNPRAALWVTANGNSAKTAPATCDG